MNNPTLLGVAAGRKMLRDSPELETVFADRYDGHGGARRRVRRPGSSMMSREQPPTSQESICRAAGHRAVISLGGSGWRVLLTLISIIKCVTGRSSPT